jgi:hypothetical protein
MRQADAVAGANRAREGEFLPGNITSTSTPKYKWCERTAFCTLASPQLHVVLA